MGSKIENLYNQCLIYPIVFEKKDFENKNREKFMEILNIKLEMAQLSFEEYFDNGKIPLERKNA